MKKKKSLLFTVLLLLTPQLPWAFHYLSRPLPRQRPGFHATPPNNGDDDVPSMDWLTDSLATSSSTGSDGTISSHNQKSDSSEQEPIPDLTQNPFVEEYDREGGLGDVPIPSTGISVQGEMDKL